MLETEDALENNLLVYFDKCLSISVSSAINFLTLYVIFGKH